MSAIAWILVILFSALLLWGLIQAVVHRFLTVDETTLSVFKLMLQHRGLDLSGLPDAALVDIVASKIGQAEAKATTADVDAGVPGDWHRYLFRLLDEEADLIETILRDGRKKHAGSDTAGVLLKYGAVEPDYPPALSVEQFIEAAKRGTLFAELDERISKRAFT